MKKIILALLFLPLIACNQEPAETSVDTPAPVTEEPAEVPKPDPEPEKTPKGEDETPVVVRTGPKANEVFRNVYVERGENLSYRVTGEARVFEASFSYVVEDGHNRLLEGHSMTDNGAPAWGAFDFIFTLPAAPDPNTVPHLILLVYSAKDGSPTHELPIPLP